MKARTDDDRKLKIQMLCDQCGAAILPAMKTCPDCKKPVMDIRRDIEEKQRRQGRFIA